MDGPGDANGPWLIIASTGEFEGLGGEGLWGGRGNGTTGFGSFLGELRFGS